MLRRLSEVGCNSLFSGIESATNEKLKFIKKGFTTDQVIDAFGVLKKYKYATTASFMVRLPEDNRQKIIDTINLAKRINPDFDKRYRAVAYQCVRRLYMRASFLNSGHRKEAEGLRAEPR